jgi:hypothetical protein
MRRGAIDVTCSPFTSNLGLRRPRRIDLWRDLKSCGAGDNSGVPVVGGRRSRIALSGKGFAIRTSGVGPPLRRIF